MIYILIYFLGAALSYLYHKRCWIEEFGLWTVGDRNRNLAFSLLSWISLLATFMTFKVTMDNDKPSKW